MAFEHGRRLTCDGPGCTNSRPAVESFARTVLAARAASWHCHEGTVLGGESRTVHLCPTCVNAKAVRLSPVARIEGQLDMFAEPDS